MFKTSKNTFKGISSNKFVTSTNLMSNAKREKNSQSISLQHMKVNFSGRKKRIIQPEKFSYMHIIDSSVSESDDEPTQSPEIKRNQSLEKSISNQTHISNQKGKASNFEKTKGKSQLTGKSDTAKFLESGENLSYNREDPEYTYA